MGVMLAVLLALGAGCVVLDAVRPRRSWQLVVAGLGFVGIAFATGLSSWAGSAALPLAAVVGVFLRGSGRRRTPVPMPEEVLSTPEPASNVRVV